MGKLLEFNNIIIINDKDHSRMATKEELDELILEELELVLTEYLNEVA